MTHSAIHDTLYRKSHRACRGNAPPSCLRKTALPLKSPTGAFIAVQTRTFRKVQSGEDLFPMKIFTAPQHTRFILPPIHPDKIHRCAAWAVFFFSGNLSGQSPSILLCKTVPLLKKTLGLSLLRYACKRKPYLENFISRPSVIPTFCQRRCINRGRNFVRSKR